MKNILSPKLGMVRCPTPFQELKNLKRELKASQNLFVKRDDCTEIGLGGNKSRKLDYIMYDVLDKKCDTVITVGGPQSNHCRQTLAFANMLGLECHLVLSGEEDDDPQGNLFLFKIMGGNLHYIEDEGDFSKYSKELELELTRKGKKPYIIPLGASVPLGSLAYIESLKEISEQAKERDLDIKHIFVATGSAGTQAGLEVGRKLYLPECKIHGVSVSRNSLEQRNLVSNLSNEVAEFIGKDFRFTPEDICVHDEYYGIKYAVPTKEGNEAIEILARTEGLLLDPVYTGKAMSGLIDLLNKGKFKENEDIVFIHTGGSPAIFNFTKSFN